MNPFIMMLINQLMNGTGTNSFWQSPFSTDPLSASNDYGNSFVRSMFGQAPENPFIFSPFPSFGQGFGGIGRGIPGQGQAPMIGRNLQRPVQQGTVPLRGGTAQTVGSGFQPVPNQQPVPIPNPVPRFQADPNQPIFDDPGNPANNPGGPLGPMIPPYQTPPYIPPRTMPQLDNQFFIEPLPGIRVPINMTGIFGQQPQNPVRTDTNYLPPVPRGLYGGR